MHPHQVVKAIRQEILPDPFSEGPWQWGKVGAVHTAPNTVDLYLDGSSTLTTGVRYLASYTPAVNDIVVVGRLVAGSGSGQDRFVLGKLG